MPQAELKAKTKELSEKDEITTQDILDLCKQADHPCLQNLYLYPEFLSPQARQAMRDFALESGRRADY